MIQQVQQSYQYHGLPGDDANKNFDKFLIVTQSMKQNGVPHDVLRLCLFPYSLTHHATAWFDCLPENSIHSWEEIVTKGLTLRHRDTINVATGGTFMKRRPEECYDLIENMTAHHNDWDTSAQRGESSKSITSSFPKIAALTQQITKMNKNFLRMSQSNQQVNVVSGGPHHYSECQASSGFTQGDVYAATGNYNTGGNSYQPQGNFNLLIYRSNSYLGPPGYLNQGFNQMTKIEKAFNEIPQDALPSNTILNPRKDIKVITIRSGITLAGPSVPPHNSSSSSSKEVERGPETTMDQVHISSSESTARVPSPVIQPDPVSKLNEIPDRNPHRPPIPYPSRLNKDKLQNKYDIQIHKFLQIIKSTKIDSSLSGNPTPYSNPVIACLSPSLTPFGDSDFFLEETDALFALDDLIPLEIDNEIYDSEGDILFLKKLLNDNPTKYLPPKELKNDETKMTKSSNEEPPELELKDLPPHLEYLLLEGTSKLLVFIAKDLKGEENDQLIKVLKSHKHFFTKTVIKQPE
ncbi:hypothetical protein Tco_0054619 [Tanacetum coccineum]